MTVPRADIPAGLEPEAPAGPMTKDRLAAEFTRILTLRYGEADPRVVAALVLAAGEYAAYMIEMYARPDDRWGPK